MNKSELFQIGDIAKLFHLSVSSLRHYEAIGLLKPERIDPTTGYRYYSVRQFNAFNVIRYLRVLDMPLDEIAAFLQNRDVAKAEAMLMKQKEAVAQKLEELRRIERKIDNRLRQLHDARNAEFDVVRIQDFPPCRIAREHDSLSIQNFLDMESPVLRLEKAQREPVIFLGKVGLGISAEHLESGEVERYDSVFLILDEEDRYAGETEEIPAERCAVIRFRGYHNESARHCRSLLEYIRKHKLQIAGFSKEITYIDYGITDDPGQFATELRIPVVPASESIREPRRAKRKTSGD